MIARLMGGLLPTFVLFHGSATALGSDFGQYGVPIVVVVVAALVVAERLFFGHAPRAAARALGLGWPAAGGMVTAAGVSLALLLVIPAFTLVTGATASMRPQWLGMLPGLFAQAGIAEEVLFRGWLFGHLRDGRTFWRAAVVSMAPFVGVHLLLFLTMPWPVALAAIALSAVLSFPLACLYELGGRTIWAPALAHFAVQGLVKITIVDSAQFPIVWMAACALLVPALTLIAAAGSWRTRSSPG